MTDFSRRYSLTYEGANYGVYARSAMILSDALHLTTRVDEPDGGAGTSAYLGRDDAISLAWGILEHFGVAEQPRDPLAVGDFVVTNGGHIGRVVDIDIDEPALYVEGPSTSPNWKYTHDTHRITKEEFVEKFLAKATEEINTFVGED